MTKETYRELEALAVESVKRGLASHGGIGGDQGSQALVTMGLQALKTLHEIRFPGSTPVAED